MSGVGALVSAALMAAVPPAPPSAVPAPPGAIRRPGPAGSLLIVEDDHSVPLVHVIVASRSGSAADPRHREGLTNLAAEWARHGAGGRTRAALDEAFDALGGTLEVHTEQDVTRLEGEVLARNLDAYLALVADILIRPAFAPAEFARTRLEVEAQIDEGRNDDRQLCERFFMRNVYGEHPYGHPVDGLKASLDAATASEAAAHFRHHFGGKNLIFAFSGDVEPEALARTLEHTFRGLSAAPAPPPNALELRPPVSLTGWRIQLVDKPERQQTQLMFGHPTLRAADPDYVALQVAVAAFGGRAMSATLMDEVRRKRGLAYGAYLVLQERRGSGATLGWVFSGTEKTVPTLKLVLKLYVALMEKGLAPADVAFFQRFLAGSHGADMDVPEQRLAARVSAEIAGLPGDFVDTFAARVAAVTPAEVNDAIKRHIHARDLAITMVATAPEMKKLLVEAKIQESAIDVVPYDSY
ncbi:MAG TPA: pitrilysin family protein [Polyangia bacterium]|nr:pitrilysin family protein [Polyangia bacterium]